MMTKITSTKIKTFSLVILWALTALSVFGALQALKIPTNYSMDQFLPKKHPLLTADRESKKVFQISDSSPHILLLSRKKGTWLDEQGLIELSQLSERIASLSGVQGVVSLANIPSAFESKNELLVSTLPELRKQGLQTSAILENPLYSPNLISRDGRHVSIFVLPGSLTQDQHRELVKKIDWLAHKIAPEAKAQVGGPAAIRTQLIDLLSREIMVFILLALLCAVLVLKIMFRGMGVLLQVLFILTMGNLIALGVMGWLKISFNILSSTLPIIVTVSSLGICTHLLVRMGEAAQKSWWERMHFLRELIQEITGTILLTGFSTCVGFACLIPSKVPLISDYGLAVALGVFASSLSTLVAVPALYVWLPWPAPRDFLSEPKRFAYFLVKRARLIVPAMAVFTVVIALVGANLSWTSRLFDELPTGHSAKRTTDLISNQLGGVANVDFMIGNDRLHEPWKHPAHIRKLHSVAEELRRSKAVSSVITLSDFLTTGARKNKLPKSKAAIAELNFLYSMSGESPLKQFLSGNEKWTRVSVRLPDLPADQNQRAIKRIRSAFEKAFPGMTVRTSGLAAIVPPMNKELSRYLMWGFFEALFWIVLLLAVAFRSLKWALIGVVPNLVPPAVLLGFLALFHVPIKPGIAIIFSISLGIAFDNTIYILGRLKALLKDRPNARKIPVYTLMKKETMPCLVSSLCLFAGFSIFLMSAFPVNQLFGLFVLLSILAGLLGDLVWLPALMRLFPWLLLDSAPRATMLKDFPFAWKPPQVAGDCHET